MRKYLFLSLIVLAPAAAGAKGSLGTPTRVVDAGIHGGIPFTRYEGIFEGRTAHSRYRVPYRIVAPTSLKDGSKTVIVEPPHFAVGPQAPNDLGDDLTFAQGLSHASVGYSLGSERILDSTVPNVFIEGGQVDWWDGFAVRDDDIVVDFAQALKDDKVAHGLLRVARRYITGFSDSSATVIRIVNSGHAEGVFDLAFPYIADGTDETSWSAEYSPDPQRAILEGRYGGKVVCVGSEGGEESFLLIDRGGLGDQYRYYGVAGTSHVTNPNADFDGAPNNRTPTSWLPSLRAHFAQADRWVRGGPALPPSTHIRVGYYDFVRDANQNAYTYETLASLGGSPKLAPRLPEIELGEARFVGTYIDGYDFPYAGFFGVADGGAVGAAVPGLAQVGFASFDAYVAAFTARVDALVAAGELLPVDAARSYCRVELGRATGLTYTQVYLGDRARFFAACP